MTFFATLIIGLMFGLLSDALTPGKNVADFITMSIVGVAGGILGRLIGKTLGLHVDAPPESLLAAVIGAVLFLLGYRYVTPLSSPGRA
jgi:uncharacterized membrane protein YeaQ/YmgE (transglycosylase-associated protein family)